MKADFHSHSHHSDGLLSPLQLVEKALARKVTHLALTDHDTVAGVADAARHAAERRLVLVPGLEVTAELHRREIHVLGLFVVPTAPELGRFAAAQQHERTDRMRRMVESLAKSGVAITFAEVQRLAGEGSMGRPHLARVLVERGYCADVQEAFQRYLGPGMAGWVERTKPTAEEAIGTIHRAGGVASIAHPGSNKISKQELAVLAGLGLDAVEAFHGDHPPNQQRAFQKWAAALGMHCTGGSDFHGEGMSLHQPGTFTTPSEEVAALQEIARRRQEGLHGGQEPSPAS